MAAEATVAEITEADIPQVAEFLARQARPGEPVIANPLPPVDRLRWLLLDNPARAVGIPVGWCIRDASRAVVGAAICIPWRIGAGGFECTALMFAKFYVDPTYRGMGLGLLMRFVRESKRFPLFVTSTNEVSGTLFSRVGASLIQRLDHTMLGVSNLGPLAEEFLYRRLKNRGAARVLALPARILPGWIGRGSKRSRDGELIEMQSAEEAIALSLPRTDKMLAVIRDRDYLHWRYFIGEKNSDVYGFRLPGEADRLIVVNRVRSGYRSQIRVLNILDVWPPATPAAASCLAAQLALRYRGQFDAIWFRSQAADVESALQGDGWVRHNFPAPLGWYIDRDNRLATYEWYLMPGESE